MKVRRYTRSQFDRDRALQLCQLWEEVWSGYASTPLEERVTDLMGAEDAFYRMEPGSEIFHVVEEGGMIVAVGRSWVREVRFEAEERAAKILALASVCSAPHRRGEGFGRSVVEDAFSRLGAGVPWCVFQTGVPEFYQKLGCERVDNNFCDSTAKDPERRPWWDEHVMVRGTGENWPEGRVDLCGVAY